MTDFTKTLTETMSVTDNTQFKRPDDVSLEINGILMNDRWEFIKYTKRINEMWSFKVKLNAVTALDHANIKEGNTVKIFYDGDTLVFKGNVDNVSYDQDEGAVITGIQSGQKKLRDRDFRVLTNGIYRETSAVQVNNIFSKVVSENVNGSSPFLLSIGTNDITATTRFHAAGDTNRFQAARNLAVLGNGEMNFRESGGSDTVDLTDQIGSASSVQTFTTSGASQNVDVAMRDNDESQLWNAVIVQGFGDGTEQIRSSEQSDATSISNNGRKEKTFNDMRMRTTSEANTLATKIKDEHKDPVEKYQVVVRDETLVLPDVVELGDTVTVDDDTIFATGDATEFRVVSMDVTFSLTRGFSVVLGLNSRVLEFTEEMEELLNRMNNVDSHGTINETRSQVVGNTNPTTAIDNTTPITTVTNAAPVSVVENWNQSEMDAGQTSTDQGHGSLGYTTESTTIVDEDLNPLSISTGGKDFNAQTVLVAYKDIVFDDGTTSFTLANGGVGTARSLTPVEFEKDFITSSSPAEDTILEWKIKTTGGVVFEEDSRDSRADPLVRNAVIIDLGGSSLTCNLQVRRTGPTSFNVGGDVGTVVIGRHFHKLTSTADGTSTQLVIQQGLAMDKSGGSGRFVVGTATDVDDASVANSASTDSAANSSSTTTAADNSPDNKEVVEQTTG